MKVKTIIGIILIILSTAALFFWERSGREMFTTTAILVCSENIHKGETVGSEDLKTMKIQKDNVLEGALFPQDAESVIGKTANTELIENQQVLPSYFSAENAVTGSGQSIFMIPKEWIFSRSSALRSGDTVSIYKMPEQTKLGTYRVAFVRDASEQEVTDIEPGAKGVLDRKDSGRTISGIEIVCTLKDFSKLYESVTSLVTVTETAGAEVVREAGADGEASEGPVDDSAEKTGSTEQNNKEETVVSANLLIVMEDVI